MPTSPKRGQFARALVLSLTLPALMSCATIQTLTSGTKQTPPASVPCEALEKFSPSRADTDGTIRQAIAHNRVFDQFCGARDE